MLKQLDLNVTRPASERLQKMYPDDSINYANVRIHFEESDEARIMQMLKDKNITPALWNFPLFRSFEEICKGPGSCPQSTHDMDYIHPDRSWWRNWLSRILRRSANRLLERRYHFKR